MRVSRKLVRSTTVRVLVADRHALLRKTFCELLEADGAVEVVAQTGNGAEAIRLVREARPAVAILEFSLLQVNGMEAARRIRSADKGVGLLIAGTWDDEAYVVAALDAGANGYVCKSANFETILQAVKDTAQAVRRARLRRHLRMCQRTHNPVGNLASRNDWRTVATTVQ